MPFPTQATLVAEGTIASRISTTVRTTEDALKAYEQSLQAVSGASFAMEALALPMAAAGASPSREGPSMDFLDGASAAPPPPPRVDLSAFVAVDDSALRWLHAERALSRERVVANAHIFAEIAIRSSIMMEQRQERESLERGITQTLRADHFHMEVLALEAAEAGGRNRVVSKEWGGFVTWVYDCMPQWKSAALGRQQARLDAEDAERRAAEKKLREADLAAQRAREAEAARVHALKMFAEQQERSAQREIELKQLAEEEARLATEVAAREARERQRKQEEEKERRRLEREAQLAELVAEEQAILRRQQEARDRQLAEAMQEEEEILKRASERESEKRRAAEERQRQIEELRRAEAAEADRQRAEAERRKQESLIRAREEEAALARRIAEREEREAAMKQAEQERARELHEQKLRTLRAHEEAAARRLEMARENEFQRLIHEDAAYGARGLPSATPAYHQQPMPQGGGQPQVHHPYPAAISSHYRDPTLFPQQQQQQQQQFQQQPQQLHPQQGGWAPQPQQVPYSAQPSSVPQGHLPQQQQHFSSGPTYTAPAAGPAPSVPQYRQQHQQYY